MPTFNPTLIQRLLEQSPLIIVLCIIGYVMWNYIKEKNAVIKQKDEQIIANQNRLMELYGKAVESQNRLTMVIEELRKDFERSNLKRGV